MSNEPRYLIDTSVFIQAYRAYYSFGVCPGFWDSLVASHKLGLVFSIDKVFEEITYGDEDELTMWSKKIIPKDFFCSTVDDSTVGWFGRIQVWANAQTQFSAAAKAAFADETDAWIVAYAGAKNLTVVTQEVFNSAIQRKVPIPNICKASPFMVPCVDVYTMLSRLGVRLVMGSGK
jgi:hypothetical protein